MTDLILKCVLVLQLLNKSAVAISDCIIGRDFKAKHADNQRFDLGFELATQVRTTACDLANSDGSSSLVCIKVRTILMSSVLCLILRSHSVFASPQPTLAHDNSLARSGYG